MASISYKSRVGASSITPLHYAELNRHGITSGGSTDMVVGTVVGSTSAWSRSSSFGMTANTNGQITVSQSGRYRISIGLQHYAAQGAGQFEIRVNGVNIQNLYVEGGDSVGDDIAWSNVKIQDLNAGDIVTLFYTGAFTNGDYYGAGSYFIVEQMPTNTYIEPQLITPTSLAYYDRGFLSTFDGTATSFVVSTTTTTTPNVSLGVNFVPFNNALFTDTYNTGHFTPTAIGVTVNKTGLYEVSFKADVNTTTSGSGSQLIIGGIIVDFGKYNENTSTPDTDGQLNLKWLGTISSGQNIQVAPIRQSAGGGDTYKDARIIIKELPSIHIMNPDDVAVTDSANTGYMDIGTMRMQWGRSTYTSGTTVTLPAPFINANYSITATGTGTSTVALVSTSTHTTTNFIIRAVDSQTAVGLSNQLISWTAIGLKP